MLAVSKKERKAGIVRKITELDNGAILCMVELEKTDIDDYQRLFSLRHANEIEANYDEKGRRLPTLSFRKNTLWRVDGNHTTTIMINMGKIVAQTEVFFGLSKKEEAELFFIRQKFVKKMSSWVGFNAAYISGRKPELNIMSIIEKCKLTTPLDDPKNHDLKNTSILTEAYNTSIPALRKLLNVLRRTYRISKKNPSLQHESKNVQFQRGLHAFLTDHTEINVNDFVAKMKSFTAADIQLQAVIIMGETGKSRADKLQIKKALEYFYFVEGKGLGKA